METTLYVIGGPARVGKSTVARALSRLLQIGWVSADVLSSAISMSGVEFPSRWSVEDARAQGENFLPYFRAFAIASESFHGSYCIEGISILPAHVAAISKEGLRVRACFLGDESMTAERILTYARGFWPDGPGRKMHLWVNELGKAGLDEYAQNIRAVSGFFREEADLHGFPYVDMGDDFDKGMARALGEMGI